MGAASKRPGRACPGRSGGSSGDRHHHRCFKEARASLPWSDEADHPNHQGGTMLQRGQGELALVGCLGCEVPTRGRTCFKEARASLPWSESITVLRPLYVSKASKRPGRACPGRPKLRLDLGDLVGLQRGQGELALVGSYRVAHLGQDISASKRPGRACPGRISSWRTGTGGTRSASKRPGRACPGRKLTNAAEPWARPRLQRGQGELALVGHDRCAGRRTLPSASKRPGRACPGRAEAGRLAPCRCKLQRGQGELALVGQDRTKSIC